MNNSTIIIVRKITLPIFYILQSQQHIRVFFQGVYLGVWVLPPSNQWWGYRPMCGTHRSKAFLPTSMLTLPNIMNNNEEINGFLLKRSFCPVLPQDLCVRGPFSLCRPLPGSSPVSLSPRCWPSITAPTLSQCHPVSWYPVFVPCQVPHLKHSLDGTDFLPDKCVLLCTAWIRFSSSISPWPLDADEDGRRKSSYFFVNFCGLLF